MCPQCKNPNPNIEEDFTAGDLVCRDCGVVVGDHLIDTRSEWRTFSNDGAGGGGADPSRVGGPSNPILNSEQLETVISTHDNFSGTSRALNKLQSRSTYKSGERTMVMNFKDISLLCERINLTKIIADRAKQHFKVAHESKKFRGKGSAGLVAACIYTACREERAARTFREISSLTHVPKPEIGKSYKILVKLLDSKMTTVGISDFILRFCNYLKLTQDVQRETEHFAKQLTQKGYLAGKSPISIASAVLFLISQLFPGSNKSFHDIAFVSGVSENTIKSTYRELLVYAKELVSAHLVGSLEKLPAP